MFAIRVEYGVGLAAGLQLLRLVADDLRVKRPCLRRVVRPELRPAPAAVTQVAAERSLRLREDQRRAVEILEQREAAPARQLRHVRANRRAERLRGRDRLLDVDYVDRGEPRRLRDVRDPVLDLRDARERRAVAAHQEVARRAGVDLPAEESLIEADRRERVLGLQREPVDLARGVAEARHDQRRPDRGAGREQRCSVT